MTSSSSAEYAAAAPLAVQDCADDPARAADLVPKPAPGMDGSLGRGNRGETSGVASTSSSASVRVPASARPPPASTDPKMVGSGPCYLTTSW